MTVSATKRLVRCTELVIRPLGDGGQHVVKNPRTGDFFHLGEQEHFLLDQLDGEKDAAAICRAFGERFCESLSEEDLNDFLEIADERGLLESSSVRRGSPDSAEGLPEDLHARSKRPAVDGSGGSGDARTTRPARSRQSLLYWRKTLFDPDRFCTWLEPRIRFFWTPAFLIFSAGSIAWAAALVWLNRHELASTFHGALRCETLLLVWLTMLAVTMLHEFAHGLTCKHYGGKVHEIGFLLLFFMPCFYCNVSDAWLLREKSKRLWVTFAGGYFELFVWSLAVFTWRVTLPDSTVNYLAFVVLTMCGVQTLFNFNPLIKLDGYYLLSDWLEVPNLQQRGFACWKEHLRWLLWGAPRPVPVPHAKALLRFGLTSWFYSLVFLSLMLWAMFWFLTDKWGVIGMSAVTMIGLVSSRGLLQDTTAGEVRRMLTRRQKRTVAWLLLLAGLAAVLTFVKIDNRVGGKFIVRPAVRSEVRAPTAGFLKELYVDEGQQISTGTLVAQLEIPDLASLRARKQAEMAETTAQLRQLEAGTRHEEIDQQRERVRRATIWRDLGRSDLEKRRQVLAENLARLDTQITACQAELDVAKDSYARAATLVGRRSIPEVEYHEAEGKYRVSQARFKQAQAEKLRRAGQWHIGGGSGVGPPPKRASRRRSRARVAGCRHSPGGNRGGASPSGPTRRGTSLFGTARRAADHHRASVRHDDDRPAQGEDRAIRA